MAKERSRSAYGVQLRRKQTIHTTVMVIIISLFAASLSGVFIYWRNLMGNEKKALLQVWEEGAYEDAYRISKERLVNKPMDYFLLTLHGFSAYQLAVAQINSYDTLNYIDECIWSLRKSLICREGAGDYRIPYVLGKAYYYKGTAYADLAVKYLEEARRGSYNAGDIPEYLGLSYAAIHDFRSSVAAFSLALDPHTGFDSENGAAQPDRSPSDLLLLSIARSYVELDELDSAKAYLIRCLETSRDSNIRITARLLLGNILGKSVDTPGAETQYLTLLEEDGENAETHYQLGELYSGAGDPTRARAEWRKAVRIDPAHRQARLRLNM
jgi:tetratricopeptide (TPR) repeat protein